MRRVRILLPAAADDPEGQVRFGAFAQGLQQLSWTDGRNVRIDIRSDAGDVGDARKYGAEWVALAPRRSGGWAEETLSDTLPAIRNIAISGCNCGCADDARTREVGPRHSSDETGEQ